jgi:hypothetical protein
MWTTRKELEAVLAQAGPGEWSPRLAAAARRAMILEPGPVEESADAPIGASRLGGTPDLPAEVPWPWRPALPNRTVFKDYLARVWPLSFVAQIGFAEILSAMNITDAPLVPHVSIGSQKKSSRPDVGNPSSPPTSVRPGWGHREEECSW